MFDISLWELLTVFLVGMLVLKPKDIISIFAKIKNFNTTIAGDNSLDFQRIDIIEDIENKFSFRNEEKGEKR